MRYLVIGLSYGCEVKPTLDFLRVAFPELRFTDESPEWGRLALNIYAQGPFDAKQLDHMRTVATAFRDGFSKGFTLGFDDCAKYGT